MNRLLLGAALALLATTAVAEDTALPPAEGILQWSQAQATIGYRSPVATMSATVAPGSAAPSREPDRASPGFICSPPPGAVTGE